MSSGHPSVSPGAVLKAARIGVSTPWAQDVTNSV